MVQLQEIADDVAQKLTLGGDGSGASKAAQTEVMPGKAGAERPAAAAGPELPPAMAATRGKTAEEILADLNKSPLFMTELEDNDDVAALQALAYEGTPLENAADFKERGNECFRESKWADAREFYGKGVALLVAEDRRRARGEPPPPPPQESQSSSAAAAADADSADEVAAQHALLGLLYANRAACQLELRNFRACTLDCGAALRLNPANTKAWFRSARALLALDKTDEARDACAGGLAAAPQNAALQQLARDVDARAAAVAARRRREADRLAHEARKRQRLRAVLRARGVRTRTTAQPPELEDAAVQLVPEDDGAPDLDVAAHVLSFPTVLLYPLALQSDFVKAFAETESLGDHLSYILPVPWDASGTDYASAAAVDCYMETIAGGLVKVGKKMPLGRILAQASVEVVDDVVRVFVVPRGQAEAWVADFKQKRAAERGERTG